VGATYTLASGNSGPTVQVTGSGSIPTDFMKVVGLPNVGFGTSSTAAWGSNLLRVALVLDNTGSMTSFNKIGALKTAAQNLVTQLSGIAQNPGDVYISVVPFEIDVNVGNTTSNLNASWLRWDIWDPSQDHCTGTYINATVMSYAACLGHNFTWHHTVGSPPSDEFSGRPGRQLPFGADPAADLQLDRRQHHHQRDDGERCDEPDYRPAMGLALAAATIAVERAGGKLELELSAHHRAVHRRLEHRRPLVR